MEPEVGQEVEWDMIPERGGVGSPRESTLTWRLGNLGSHLPLTLDLRPGSATFWVTLGKSLRLLESQLLHL